jgi:CarD family transcriptional regulator
MQYSVGDKVVHPHHGPGRITSVESKDLLGGKKRYYVIEIPTKDLTVYVPLRKVDQAGVRPAMSQARLSDVLDKLKSTPHHLPEDYKERQEQVWEMLRTGMVMPIAEVVRDLVWQKKRDHLTKKDADLLAQGQERLAAEMALISGTEVSDMEKTIEDVLADAMTDEADRGQPRQQLLQTAGLARG